MWLFVQVDIEVGVGHGDALFVKDGLDPLVQSEIHIPVVFGLDPDAEAVVDGTLAVAGEYSHGCGVQQDLVHGAGQGQCVNDLLGGDGIGGGDGNLYTAGALGGVIDDLGGDDSTVGDGDDLVIRVESLV